jgi:hypothetical protein
MTAGSLIFGNPQVLWFTSDHMGEAYAHEKAAAFLLRRTSVAGASRMASLVQVTASRLTKPH